MAESEQPRNLYVHFPFCRRKCSYCALYSRAGTTPERRADYITALIRQASQSDCLVPNGLSTVYFGGGTPALCELGPLLDALRPHLASDVEFTVELHPLDVTRDLVEALHAGGVNRISMGVQSLDDDILTHMRRGYGFAEAERAFALVRERFDNAGIDLIVGYPGETAALSPRHARLAKWGLRHCSVYSLQNERGLKNAVDDETTMNRIAIVSKFLAEIGLVRYEISNYAVPGYECRHNLAVWRGEDYLGLGDGACGRVGLVRTRGRCAADGAIAYDTETVAEDFDRRERRLFSLRTREGIDPSGFPEWLPSLERQAAEGTLAKTDGGRYRLTERGTEVCDALLAELV